MLVLTREQIRQLDADAVRELGIPSLLLMENAARGAVEVLRSTGPWNSITLVCGPGNNGGDGLAMARLLAADSISSTVLLVRSGKSLSADAADNNRLLLASGLSVAEPGAQEVSIHLQRLTSHDLIVDALLGTGLRGPLAEDFRTVISAINRSSAPVLAIDVPSGIDCDTGRPIENESAVRASQTATFGAVKAGFVLPEAAEWTGRVTVCHIGLAQDWLQAWFSRLHREDQHFQSDAD